jgi:serine/threonine protein kinase
VKKLSIDLIRSRGVSAQEIENSLKSEISLLRGLNHPNIVRMYNALEDEEARLVYMIMEFCERGAFLSESHLKSIAADQPSNPEYCSIQGQTYRWKLGFKKARRYTVELISGLLYSSIGGDLVHNDFNMVHYDIKPDNILVDKDDIAKYTDFGTSVALDMLKNDDKITRVKGTPIYHAPEVWAKSKLHLNILDKQHYGKPLDIWALGCTLYELFYNTFPFEVSLNSVEMGAKILDNK